MLSSAKTQVKRLGFTSALHPRTNREGRDATFKFFEALPQ
jgi:hypothetical protein